MKAILLSPKAWLALLLVAGLSGVAYWQRQPVLAWYYVRQLTHTYQENRDGYARKVAALEEAALPRVLEGLQSSDAIVCANMQYALLLMTEQWGVTDPRSQRLVECLNIRFGDFSPVGQEKIVLLLTAFLQQNGPKPLPPRLTKEVSEILLAAEKKSELRAVALL